MSRPWVSDGAGVARDTPIGQGIWVGVQGEAVWVAAIRHYHCIFAGTKSVAAICILARTIDTIASEAC